MQLVRFFLSERPVGLGLWYAYIRLCRSARYPYSSLGEEGLYYESALQNVLVSYRRSCIILYIVIKLGCVACSFV